MGRKKKSLTGVRLGPRLPGIDRSELCLRMGCFPYAALASGRWSRTHGWLKSWSVDAGTRFVYGLGKKVLPPPECKPKDDPCDQATAGNDGADSHAVGLLVSRVQQQLLLDLLAELARL